MTSAIDKTPKTCLYADVIENDLLTLFKDVDVLTSRKARGNLMINVEKRKTTLADKIDFYYINGNMKSGFLYSQEQLLLERSIF